MSEIKVVERDASDFEFSIPVLIAGAGACGLTAALAAHDAGADVLVLERDAKPFGSTGMSYGAICAAGTRKQQEAGIQDTGEALAEDIIAATKGQTDPDYAARVARQSGPTVDWLIEQHGLSLELEVGWTGFGHRVPRLHAPANRTGEELMSMLQNAVSAAAIDILTEARLTTLYKGGDGRVTGVGVTRPDGSTEEIACDNLILATCGFGANHEMVARFAPDIANADYYGHESNEGDGILLGQQMGGVLADMGAYQALGALATPYNLVIPHVILIGGGVQINALGKRFENELHNISGQALTILEQPGGYCWMVTNEALHEDALGRFDEYRQAVAMGAVRSAETPRDLAALMKVPPETFEAEIAGVVELARTGKTDEFGRDFSNALPLEGRLYATKVRGALFHTQGGLVVNERAQVVRQDGTAIPNLYAGGGAARGLAGPGNWGYLPGAGLMMAVTLGRIAGEEAAKSVTQTTGS
ncbi:MAG: FAD-binding protein [Alphaproteobacteria bacterium]|nr:MAG: FAD-binding protein [Alphaproteobacteria bacterium]